MGREKKLENWLEGADQSIDRLDHEAGSRSHWPMDPWMKKSDD
jgi:hypothetical protein